LSNCTYPPHTPNLTLNLNLNLNPPERERHCSGRLDLLPLGSFKRIPVLGALEARKESMIAAKQFGPRNPMARVINFDDRMMGD
jgi:hypothetical protein